MAIKVNDYFTFFKIFRKKMPENFAERNLFCTFVLLYLYSCFSTIKIKKQIINIENT